MLLFFFIRLSLTDVPFPETFLADALGLRSGKKAFLLESWEGKALALTERTKVEGDFSLGMWEAPSMGLAEHILQLNFPFILEGLFLVRFVETKETFNCKKKDFFF